MYENDTVPSLCVTLYKAWKHVAKKLCRCAEGCPCDPDGKIRQTGALLHAAWQQEIMTYMDRRADAVFERMGVQPHGLGSTSGVVHTKYGAITYHSVGGEGSVDWSIDLHLKEG